VSPHTPAPVRLLVGAAILAGLPACATKGDVQMVQGEVSLLKAETARRDSARAAQLGEVIRMQQSIMDSLGASRRAVGQLKGDFGTDLYNIQQQLVQLQELTGQSQQRLSELRNQVELRGAQIQGAPGDSAQPQGAANPSADQMYEASLAQLRRGSTSTARIGLREMLKTYPTSSHARVIRPRIPTRRRLTTGRWSMATRHRFARRRHCTTSGSSPSGGRISPRRRMPISGWSRSTLNRTKPRSLVTD